MKVNKTLRLNKVLRELNISLDRAVEYMAGLDMETEARPTTKLTVEEYNLLLEGFQSDPQKKLSQLRLVKIKEMN